MTYIIIEHKCEECDDTGAQVQDSGPLMGMIRPCPKCAPTYEKYIDKYGTDPEENPLMLLEMDEETGRQTVRKVTNKERHANVTYLPDGTEFII